jgi:hypothetical protein
VGARDTGELAKKGGAAQRHGKLDPELRAASQVRVHQA